MIFICGTRTENVPEFLDYHLKPLMQSGKSYIKDSKHFLGKKTLGCVPNNAILVAADVVKLYSSIPYQTVLIPLKNPLTRVFKKRYLLTTRSRWQNLR